jgi:hypothetical protein
VINNRFHDSLFAANNSLTGGRSSEPTRNTCIF